MAIKDRRIRERDQTRERIMDAARRLFAHDGYEAVSMRRIATEIEYSATAIYVHFKDKRDLFSAICAEDFAALAKAAGDIDRVADPVERLAKLGLAYCRFGLEHPNSYRLLFMTPIEKTETDAALRPEKGDPSADSWAMCLMTVAAIAEAGRLRPEFSDVELAAQTVWAGVHGVVSLEIAMGRDSWIDWRPARRRVKAMLETLVRGICTEKAVSTKRGPR
jgi:AcrR family transcriptional regulator